MLKNPMTNERFASTTWANGSEKLDEAKVRENFSRVRQDVLRTSGVVRWASNDSVPFSDMLGDFLFLGLITRAQYDASVTARGVDLDKFTAEYRKAQANRKPSEEEMFEMRAAFGPGATVVNVLTGRKTKL